MSSFRARSRDSSAARIRLLFASPAVYAPPWPAIKLSRYRSGVLLWSAVVVSVSVPRKVGAAVVRRALTAFTYRDFRVLWFGAFTSTVGNWMQEVAQAWLVFELTKSSFYLGLDDFLGQLPILLFTLIGGVVADRHDRRHVLLGSQLVQMATAFTLAALIYWHVVRVSHILLLSFVAGLGQA